MEDYTFKKFDNDLNKGFQIYLTYVNNRYLVYKTAANCYTQELVSSDDKNPHPRLTVITRKRLREIFKFSTDHEYKMM